MPALWRRLKPYALLFLLALPALWPSPGAGIPRTNDNLTHFYRAVELDQLVRAGIFFPRWAPHLVFNFGYPIFDFFPYEAHYLVESLHLLGLSFLTAYNLAGALILLASGVFAFQLGREHFGELGGLVAGVAYLYSPYILYDNYIRGSLPESLALALLPLALLCVRRAVRGDRPAVAWAGLALAAAIFGHHGVMLQAMPFVGLYALWEYAGLGLAACHWRLAQGWARLKSEWRSRGLLTSSLQSLVLPFVLALGLSAFFWLPALIESPYVQTVRGTGNGSMNYANNFLGLDQLFALPRLPVDADLLNPPVVHSLPLAALVLAALAVARFAWPRTRPRAAAHQTWSILYFGAAALVATLLIHPIAKPLWDRLTLLQLTLFPWRLLGPVSLFVALIAAALFAQDGRKTKDEGRIVGPFVFRLSSFVLVSLAILFLILAGLPFATPPREPVTANPTLADLAAFEVPPDFIGTTTVGEYLPIWVHQLPDDVNVNRTRLSRGQSVPQYVAPGATVQPGPAHAVGADFTVQALQALTFTYQTFYFPGWRASLDGQPAPITITSPEGLMSIAVPSGTHTISFNFGTTWPRVLGDTLSILGLLAFGAWLAWPLLARRRTVEGATSAPLQPVAPNESAPTLTGTPSLKGRGWGLGLVAVAAFLALARPLLYDAGRTPLLRRGLASQPPQVASQPLDLSFSGEVHLLGADLPTRPVANGAPFEVTLYWQAEHPLGVDYAFDMLLMDAAGHRWNERGYTRPADWRFSPGTDFWPVGQYILDPYVLTLLPGTPPGAYTLEASVFARYNQQSIGTQPVGAITVGSPSRSPACPDSLGAAPDQGIQLRQSDLSPAGAAPGQEVTLSLCWLAASAPGADLTGQLRLVDAAGQAQLPDQSFPLGSSYPTSHWAAGDVVRDQVTVLLPAAVATGQYTWTVSTAGSPAIALGQETVTAPARSFSPPAVDRRVNAGLGPVTLYGFSGLSPSLTPGAQLKLSLAWLANQTLGLSYHVFVHLQNAAGELVAQSDGVPADWTRPTTGWLPGEYVLDPRSLTLPPNLPPGQYSLLAGLYDPDTGQRLTTAAFPDGQIPVGMVRVGQ